VISLTVTMSKFLALGLSLEQIIERTTINPARVLREEHRRGTLKPGMPADISILELVDGDFTFADGEGGGTMAGRSLLKPVLTLKGGQEITPKLLLSPPGEAG
ncbi:MAG: amidohydrolase family protein, partial [Chloroflexota bacterium]